jgi:hypothetical protein
MKCGSALFLAAGLASAAVINPNVQNSVQAAGINEANVNAQGQSLSNLFNSSSVNSSNINIGDANFDPASLGLGNVAGVNLGQLDFSNQNDIAAAILAMMNALCLGNLFNQNSILALGQNNDLALLLELAQLMQLEQLGFINLFDVQSLLASAFLGNNNNNNFGNNALNLGNGLNLGNNFNFGSFKRAVEERKKTMKRTVLRRATKTRTKRQCQAGVVDPNAAVGVAPGVAAPVASAAPVVAEPAATEVPAAPVATEPVAAPAPAVVEPVTAPAVAPAAAPADDGESLADFTR